ncbi:MAG: tyrosine-type recombinase/integrase [Vicinamibacterales bacterium]
MQLLKASFRWAAKKGYITRSPISEDSSLKRTKIAQRRDGSSLTCSTRTARSRKRARSGVNSRRRIPALQRLIIAALETGCRPGELLGLQWRDVDLDRRELRVRAENAKDGEDRVLPISTRLAAVLAMAKTDPAGKDYESDKYPFGELGERIANTKRSWENACEKPEW